VAQRNDNRRPDGGEIRQKGKGKARGRGWHQRRELVELPEVGSGADPTTGKPTPLHEHERRRRKGRGAAL
jgi:hypothetical protein